MDKRKRHGTQIGRPEDRSDISIRPMRKPDIDGIIGLHAEFEQYLLCLDPNRRCKSDEEFRGILIRDGFGRGRAFYGFVAERLTKKIGYILYHFGYDPDEMEGRVVYVIDLFVTAVERKLGVGSLLVEEVASMCRRSNAIDIYFGVWTRNRSARAFYKRIGASEKDDLPFMHCERAKWPKEVREQSH
jgi:GNAT superfamily N-acetyltransferase